MSTPLTPYPEPRHPLIEAAERQFLLARDAIDGGLRCLAALEQQQRAAALARQRESAPPATPSVPPTLGDQAYPSPSRPPAAQEPSRDAEPHQQPEEGDDSHVADALARAQRAGGRRR